MSAFTDRLYRQWLGQNRGGIGGVAPDAKPQRRPAKPAGRGHPTLQSKDAASRPEKLSSFISDGKDFNHDK